MKFLHYILGDQVADEYWDLTWSPKIGPIFWTQLIGHRVIITNQTEKEMQRARALYQFDGAVSSDLPLREGEIVTIINKLPGNLWWVGESADGRIGTFPYNYVEELPPEPEFEEFIGKKGISNLDIIQFDKVSQDGDQSITT